MCTRVTKDVGCQREDEMHVLFECPLYHHQRAMYFNQRGIPIPTLPSAEDMKSTLNPKNEHDWHALAFSLKSYEETRQLFTDALTIVTEDDTLALPHHI